MYASKFADRTYTSGKWLSFVPNYHERPLAHCWPIPSCTARSYVLCLLAAHCFWCIYAQLRCSSSTLHCHMARGMWAPSVPGMRVERVQGSCDATGAAKQSMKSRTGSVTLGGQMDVTRMNPCPIGSLQIARTSVLAPACMNPCLTWVSLYRLRLRGPRLRVDTHSL